MVHLSTTTSDHIPILLHLSLDHPKTSRTFRFFEAWTRDLSCEQVIREVWHTRGCHGQCLSVTTKLCVTAKALSAWNRSVFGYSDNRIRDLEGQIASLQSFQPSVDTIRKEFELQKELDERLESLESIWRQKSRELWLVAEDRNSKFFHESTIANRMTNGLTEENLLDFSSASNSQSCSKQKTFPNVSA